MYIAQIDASADLYIYYMRIKLHIGLNNSLRRRQIRACCLSGPTFKPGSHLSQGSGVTSSGRCDRVNSIPMQKQSNICQIL